jgi:hypothetical protein
VDEGTAGSMADKEDVHAPPPEECKKDMLAMVKFARVRSGLWYPPSADTGAKLECVYGYVYTFLAKFKKSAISRPWRCGRGERARRP